MSYSTLEKDIQKIIAEAKREDYSAQQIQKAIKCSLKTIKQKHQGNGDTTCAILTLLTKIALWILFSIAIFALLLAFSPGLQKLVEPYIIKHVSYVTKAVRKYSIPLTEYFDRFEWQKWHSDDCLIDNPYKQPINISCDACRHLDDIITVTTIDEETFKQTYHRMIAPLKIVETGQKPVVFLELRQQYFEWANMSQMGINWMESDSTDIRNVTEFMQAMTERDILKEANFRAVWHMKRAGPSAFLRKFFPLPSFLPRHSEVRLEQRLIIEGRAAGDNTVFTDKPASCLYTQGAGEQHITLMPNKQCTDSCRNLTTTLTTGQAIYVDCFQLAIVTRPVHEQAQSISLSMLRYFD